MLGISALALVLILGVAIVVIVDRVPRDRVQGPVPGALTVNDDAIGQWMVGTVEVVLSETGLRMLDTARDGLVVWESAQQRAFVLGTLGSVGWREYRGYFWPDVRHDCELVDQEVRFATDDGGRLEISGIIVGCGQQREYTIDVRRGAEPGDVVLDVESRGVDALTLVSARTSGTGVHGFGEQFAPFDLSGRLIPIVVREQGIGRGEQPVTAVLNLARNGVGGTDAMTYAAWPSFVTGDVRGVELDPTQDGSHAFAVADTRDRATVALTSWHPQLTARLTADTDPRDLIERRSSSQNRPELPDWLFSGAVLGIQGGTQEVRDAVDDLLGAGADLSAVWVQDWTGRRVAELGDRLWWTWQLDTARYPNWDEMVGDFANRGIRTLTYVNTWLVDATPKGDPGIRNLFAEAANAGYLVRDRDGGEYLVDQGGFAAALVDLTNADARTWLAEVIATEVLGRGVDGFMADFGEGLPFDAVLADGDPAIEHNRWPLLWAATVREACERADKPNCVVWFRTGSGGMAAQAPLFWNGDQLVTYGPQDGMASALLGSFSAGVSGWHLTHSDIGGYTSGSVAILDYSRPPDLNQRWAEMEAFGTIMRTHEGNRPADNEQVYDTEQTRAAFARMTRLYSALEPYRADVIDQAVQTGVPAIRHGWLEYPGTLAAESDAQFFFGPSVLVAPVFADGQDEVEVAFPPGTWVHLLTGEEFAGDRVTSVPAPLGQPAAFVRADDERLLELARMVDRADL